MLATTPVCLIGIVHLKGTISNATDTDNALTLPPGYRPSQDLFLPMAAGGPVAANLSIGTDGTVFPTCEGAGACFAGIDGLTFRVP